MIGKVIQEKRKAAGLTQAQLAELLGVSAPAVNRWEKDLSYPDADLLSPLARLLKTDLNSLFSFYDSLTENERERAVDKAREMLLTTTDEEALSFIDSTLKQNLSDGYLYFQMAEMLYGFHVFRQTSEPYIYLAEIASYYERACELLPEKSDSIAYSLMNIYAELGDYDKAKNALSTIRDSKIDKEWAQVELLYATKQYDDAIPAMKKEILKRVVALSAKLDLMRSAYNMAGRSDLSALANEKSTQLRSLFGLWSGFDIMSEITHAISSKDPETEQMNLAKFINMDCSDELLSNDPLFSDVSLEGSAENPSTAELMAQIMRVLQEKAK